MGAEGEQGYVMTAAELLRLHNRGMIAFDLALGTAALVAPERLLELLGHDPPAEDARWLMRRNGPVWLTFAAAHAVAALRDEPRDWWALAWLRATELCTDALWARSPAFRRPGARRTLRLAGAANGVMSVGFAALGRRR
jgi:hypothetical protein